MDYDVNEIAFEAIYFFDDSAMEGGIKDFITSIIKKVKEWWTKTALPFIMKIARGVKTFFEKLVKNAAKVPKGIWKYIITLGGKFKSVFDKRASDAIIIGDEEFEIPSDAIAGIESSGIESYEDLLFNDCGISMEAQMKNNPDEISDSIFGGDMVSVEKEIEHTKNQNFDHRDFVDDKDLKKEAERASKAISGTIEKFANSNKDAYKNLENALKNNEDANIASKKANLWMSKASSFFKAIADFFKRFFGKIKSVLQNKNS